MNNPPFLFESKKCSRCKQFKPIEEFGKRKPGKWRNENFNSQCKSCERERKNVYMQGYRKNNPERIKEIDRVWRKKNRRKVRNWNLLKVYGITLLEYDALLEKQNYKCLICKAEHSELTRETLLNVDHCHQSKKIRGLLCHNCNKGLGHFRDDPALLRGAIKYLSHH